MKKYLILLFLFIPLIAFGQGSWLFDINKHPAVIATKNKEITTDLKLKLKADSTYILHTIRAAVSVEGYQYLFNKVTKEFEGDTFKKIGLGVSYSFYSVKEGVATKYLSLNGFLFLPINEGDKVSMAFSVSALNLFGLNVNPDIGVNFEPGLIKSDYVPVGLLLKLVYVF